MMAAALAAAREGLFVFPVHGIRPNGHCTCQAGAACRTPGKHPRIGDWQRRAAVRESTIREWWTNWPKANIGCHVGLSGLAVIDVDPRNGGDETFASLCEKHGPIVSAMEVQTGGGGSHFYFCAPENTHLPVTLGDGIDLQRGDKYVILPPSLHASGKRYEWKPSSGVDGRCLLDDLPGWCGAKLIHPVAARIENSVSSSLDTDEGEDVFLRLINERRAEDQERNLERARSALDCIPADDRGTWVTVLAALKQYFGEDGRELADEWAQSSPKYDADDQERTWNGFADRTGGANIGTIFHLAKQHGWIESAQRDSSGESDADTGGDISNGRRFAKAYRGILLFCGALKKWLRWDGLRWGWCNVGEPIQLAKRIAAQLLDEAAAELRKGGTEEAKQKFRQAVTVHNTERRVHSMVSMAASEPGMQIAQPGDLDANPMLLGVRNGVLNLRTGALLSPDPSMLITRQISAAFEGSAPCPQWEAFLTAIFEGDAEVIAFIQRAIGYTLTGLVDEEKIFFMYGHGANGKSVFANIIAGIFGDYAVTIGSELLARKQGSESDRFKVKLPGARLALANEVGSGDVWDDQKVKEIASRERIAARQLYGEAFDFMPTHALWIRGNHKPGIMDAGDGMWRRIVLIPFRRQFGEGERVPDLDRKILDAERDGILRWMVDGCLAWQRGGLKVPEVIRRETAAYRSDTDLLGAWIDEACTPGADRRLQSGEAYRSYRVFLDGQGVKYPSQIAFVRHMVERGFAAARSNGVRYLTGLDLKSANGDEGDDL